MVSFAAALIEQAEALQKRSSDSCRFDQVLRAARFGRLRQPPPTPPQHGPRGGSDQRSLTATDYPSASSDAATLLRYGDAAQAHAQVQKLQSRLERLRRQVDSTIAFSGLPNPHRDTLRAPPPPPPAGAASLRAPLPVGRDDVRWSPPRRRRPESPRRTAGPAAPPPSAPPPEPPAAPAPAPSAAPPATCAAAAPPAPGAAAAPAAAATPPAAAAPRTPPCGLHLPSGIEADSDPGRAAAAPPKAAPPAVPPPAPPPQRGDLGAVWQPAGSDPERDSIATGAWASRSPTRSRSRSPAPQAAAPARRHSAPAGSRRASQDSRPPQGPPVGCEGRRTLVGAPRRRGAAAQKAVAVGVTDGPAGPPRPAEQQEAAPREPRPALALKAPPPQPVARPPPQGRGAAREEASGDLDESPSPRGGRDRAAPADGEEMPSLGEVVQDTLSHALAIAGAGTTPPGWRSPRRRTSVSPPGTGTPPRRASGGSARRRELCDAATSPLTPPGRSQGEPAGGGAPQIPPELALELEQRVAQLGLALGAQQRELAAEVSAAAAGELRRALRERGEEARELRDELALLRAETRRRRTAEGRPALPRRPPPAASHGEPPPPPSSASSADSGPPRRVPPLPPAESPHPGRPDSAAAAAATAGARAPAAAAAAAAAARSTPAAPPTAPPARRPPRCAEPPGAPTSPRRDGPPSRANQGRAGSAERNSPGLGRGPSPSPIRPLRYSVSPSPASASASPVRLADASPSPRHHLQVPPREPSARPPRRSRAVLSPPPPPAAPPPPQPRAAPSTPQGTPQAAPLGRLRAPSPTASKGRQAGAARASPRPAGVALANGTSTARSAAQTPSPRRGPRPAGSPAPSSRARPCARTRGAPAPAAPIRSPLAQPAAPSWSADEVESPLVPEAGGVGVTQYAGPPPHRAPASDVARALHRTREIEGAVEAAALLGPLCRRSTLQKLSSATDRFCASSPGRERSPPLDHRTLLQGGRVDDHPLVAAAAAAACHMAAQMREPSPRRPAAGPRGSDGAPTRLEECRSSTPQPRQRAPSPQCASAGAGPPRASTPSSASRGASSVQLRRGYELRRDERKQAKRAQRDKGGDWRYARAPPWSAPAVKSPFVDAIVSDDPDGAESGARVSAPTSDSGDPDEDWAERVRQAAQYHAAAAPLQPRMVLADPHGAGRDAGVMWAELHRGLLEIMRRGEQRLIDASADEAWGRRQLRDDERRHRERIADSAARDRRRLLHRPAAAPAEEPAPAPAPPAAAPGGPFATPPPARSAHPAPQPAAPPPAGPPGSDREPDGPSRAPAAAPVPAAEGAPLGTAEGAAPGAAAGGAAQDPAAGEEPLPPLRAGAEEDGEQGAPRRAPSSSPRPPGSAGRGAGRGRGRPPESPQQPGPAAEAAAAAAAPPPPLPAGVERPGAHRGGGRGRGGAARGQPANGPQQAIAVRPLGSPSLAESVAGSEPKSAFGGSAGGRGRGRGRGSASPTPGTPGRDTSAMSSPPPTGRGRRSSGQRSPALPVPLPSAAQPPQPLPDDSVLARSTVSIPLSLVPQMQEHPRGDGTPARNTARPPRPSTPAGSAAPQRAPSSLSAAVTALARSPARGTSSPAHSRSGQSTGSLAERLRAAAPAAGSPSMRAQTGLLAERLARASAAPGGAGRGGAGRGRGRGRGAAAVPAAADAGSPLGPPARTTPADGTEAPRGVVT
eukprot:TRINITY_DN2034_c0_g2_i2.p1 TRINITY_DN2034_c0_g2~~TRINITY_DN2034_c0_g2_i2.p1  ORF type:complete len:1700 (+),score=224.23 TRINITY_DN2034_c0_g2_i2:65-5164(+)